MSGIQELVVGLVIVVGLVGGTTQLIPGGLVIVGVVLVWAVMTGGADAWAATVERLEPTLAGMSVHTDRGVVVDLALADAATLALGDVRWLRVDPSRVWFVEVR